MENSQISGFLQEAVSSSKGTCIISHQDRPEERKSDHMVRLEESSVYWIRRGIFWHHLGIQPFLAQVLEVDAVEQTFQEKRIAQKFYFAFTYLCICYILSLKCTVLIWQGFNCFLFYIFSALHFVGSLTKCLMNDGPINFPTKVL